MIKLIRLWFAPEIIFIGDGPTRNTFVAQKWKILDGEYYFVEEKVHYVS